MAAASSLTIEMEEKTNIYKTQLMIHFKGLNLNRILGNRLDCSKGGQGNILNFLYYGSVFLRI
jgi:hypothetical protein